MKTCTACGEEMEHGGERPPSMGRGWLCVPCATGVAFDATSEFGVFPPGRWNSPTTTTPASPIPDRPPTYTGVDATPGLLSQTQ